MNKVPPLLPSFLFIFFFATQGWTAPFLHETSNSRQEALGSPETSVKVATYEGLLQAIRQTRAASQARIETAVEQEKVREAWETGKLIQEHILLNKERAQYGEQVVEKLAIDLAMSKRELQYMVEFARAYPIVPHAAQFSWSEYRDLLAVNDAKEREEIIQEATRQNWNRDQLRDEVRRRKARAGIPEEPEQLEPIKPGALNAYQTFKQEDRLRIDLGFDIYLDLPQQYENKVKEGEIAILDGSREPKRATLNDLYTYKAKVTHVVDGDTFYALIDLGFSITLYQRLRLRRLDAPELVSAEGKEAKEALEKILSRNKGQILTKISKTDDQYGRYLVDVFLSSKSDYTSIDQELMKTGLLQVRGDA